MKDPQITHWEHRLLRLSVLSLCTSNRTCKTDPCRLHSRRKTEPGVSAAGVLFTLSREEDVTARTGCRCIPQWLPGSTTTVQKQDILAIGSATVAVGPHVLGTL